MYYYRGPKDKVERALSYLAAKNPGLASHVFKYAIKVGKRPGGYAYFDYRDASVVVSKEWLKRIDHKSLAAIIAHEVLHGVLGHWLYLKEKKVSKPLVWNLAADVEVNSILEELGLLKELYSFTEKVIDEWRAEPVTWRKFSHLGVKPTDPAELVYEKLLKNCKTEGIAISVVDHKRRREESLGDEDSIPWETVTVVSDLLDALESEEKRSRPREELWEGDKEFRKDFEKRYEEYKRGNKSALTEGLGNAMVDLVAALKSAGSVPAGLERYVNPERPKLPWYLILRKSLRYGGSRSLRTWRVPNRRGLEYVPGYLNTASSVWLLVDTSASITDEELAKFLGEVIGAARYGKVNLVAWDAEPYVLTLSASKSKILKKLKEVRGGGGTLIGPALELVYKKMRPGEPVVVLTDGYWFDEFEVLEIMDKIRRKSGTAILVTTGTVPRAAEDAKWQIIELKDERP